MEKGKIIVVEGACDGIGKSTQYDLLNKWLKEEGYEVRKHHFPSYNTPQGALVEKYLKGDYGNPKDISPYFINSLYAIDRASTFKEGLEEEYKNGKILLFDRYTTSSIIYQSSTIEDPVKRKEFIDYIVDFEYNKLEIPTPDEVVFLTAPFDLVTKLREKRKDNEGIENDIHERNIEFMRRVYENAIYLADYLNWDQIHCNERNQMRSIASIHEEVVQKVKRRI